MKVFRAAVREYSRPAPCGDEFRRHGVAEPLHDVGCRAHRARDQPGVARFGPDGALPRDPDGLAEMLSCCGEVVVAVDPLGLSDHGRLSMTPELPDDPVHHLLPVQQREVLGPAELVDVARRTRGCPPRGRPGPGRAARSTTAPSAAGPRRCGAARSCCPRPGEPECRNSQTASASSSAHLDEVVARAERSRAAAASCRRTGPGRSPRPLPARSQLGNPRFGRGGDLPVVVAGRQRDGALDRLPAARLPVLGQVVAAANCVRTAIMPHPMSTPTAAGMMAPRVGMTEPTVAPRPRWASGISARCG